MICPGYTVTQYSPSGFIAHCWDGHILLAHVQIPKSIPTTDSKPVSVHVRRDYILKLDKKLAAVFCADT